MGMQQNFIKAVAKAFDLTGVGGSRLGLLSYGDGEAFVNVKFRDQMKFNQFEKVIDKLQTEPGISSIESALSVAATSMFTETSGTRFGIAKVFVMVVDETGSLSDVSKKSY